MSETADASHSPTLPLPPPKNTFQRIAGVLFAPASTFEDIARKPDVLVPMLLILVIGYINTFLMMPRMDWNAVSEAQIEAIKAKNPQMTDADLERVSRMTQAFGKVAGWIGPLLGIIWWLILAGVLLLAFRMMGGQGTFKQALSTVLYSWIPMVIYYIVVTIVAVGRGKIDPTHMVTVVKSNPAFLVDMKEHPALFSLLSALDLFTIWSIILLIFGFAALSKTTRAKAAAIIVGLWAVAVLAMAGFAGLMGKART